MNESGLVLGGKEFRSRLIVGTGKYPSLELMGEAIEASGAEIVTVAVRRVSLPGQGESILDFIDSKRYTLLPNTAGCYTADEAVRTCYLAREAGLAQILGLDRSIAQHAGPMQHFAGAQRRRSGNHRTHFTIEFSQPLQQLGVERKPLSGHGSRRETDAAIELAARDARGDQFAQARFERTQFLHHAELNIEKAVVDAFQLEKQRALRSFARERRVAGHALDHGSPRKCVVGARVWLNVT